MSCTMDLQLVILLGFIMLFLLLCYSIAWQELGSKSPFVPGGDEKMLEFDVRVLILLTVTF